MIEFYHGEIPDDESEEILEAAREAVDIDWGSISSAELSPAGGDAFHLELRAPDAFITIELARPELARGRIEIMHVQREPMDFAEPPYIGGGATRGDTAGGDAPVVGTLERYPWLDYPDRVGLNETHDLTVELTIDPPAADVDPIVIGDLPADQVIKLEAVVRAPGFDIGPSNSKRFELSREEATSVRFDLTARREGPALIRVDFYQQDRRIGIAERAAVVGDADTRAAGPETLRVTPVEVGVDVRPPDLEITVVVDPQNRRRLLFTLHSRLAAVDHHHAPMGSVELTEDPIELSKRLYGALTKLARKRGAGDNKTREARLAALGNELWQRALSDEMQAAYAKWKDKVTVLQITSGEPWIPWEMVKPVVFGANGEPMDHPFWCEQFAMSRWLAGGAAANTLGAERVRPVVPPSNLDAVKRELSFLETMSELASGFITDPAYDDAERVTELLRNGRFAIMHFAAHGNFDSGAADESSITLRDRALRPSDIQARFVGDRPRPLIFINACHGTRAGLSFTGIGGWADRLVRQTRVAAFVGASWEIDDELALTFATEFYTAFLRDGEPLAESLRRARMKIRDQAPANSSWLAYVLYGDPLARVTAV